MTMRKAIMVAATHTMFFLAASCGAQADFPESGAEAPPAKTLRELSTTERAELCRKFIAARGGEEGVVVCGNAYYQRTPITACETNLSTSECAVPIMEACLRELETDPCRLLDGPACAEAKVCHKR
ncbi:MAG: hypothetical protein IPK13_27525 [Deltaproteobacteria bacterium]|nr:hypothetical protein [Deltaproteobacteria bacterium]